MSLQYEGPWSAPEQDTTLPAAPTGLSVARRGANAARLTWMDQSVAETRYVIDRFVGTSDDGVFMPIAVLPQDTTKYVVTELNYAMTYDFRVRAEGVAGFSDATFVSYSTERVDAWQLSGESSLSGSHLFAHQTMHMGVPGRRYNDEQPSDLHGGSLRLPPQTSYTFEFSVNLSTWDSYAPKSPYPSAGPNATEGGIWDLFSISVTDLPYGQMQRHDSYSTFPGNSPFTFYSTSYREQSLATLTRTFMMTFPGNDVSEKYLNVMLDNASRPDAGVKHPSWGTVRMFQLPNVFVKTHAESDQVAEGGKTPGRFYIGMTNAHANTVIDVDYEIKIGNGPWQSERVELTVTQEFPIIEVAPPAEGALDADDRVTLRIKQNPEQYVVARGKQQSSQQNVQRLIQRRILTAFYGFGPTGDNSVNELFFESIARSISLSNELELILMPESQGREALDESA